MLVWDYLNTGAAINTSPIIIKWLIGPSVNLWSCLNNSHMADTRTSIHCGGVRYEQLHSFSFKKQEIVQHWWLTVDMLSSIISTWRTTWLFFLSFVSILLKNKYVCTRLFALFHVLNWSLNKKVYIFLKLIQFPIQV